MKKGVLSIVIILLLFSIPINSQSLFPSKDKQIYPSYLSINKVLYSNNTVQLLVESETQEKISGLIVTVKFKDNTEFIETTEDNLFPYSSRYFTFSLPENKQPVFLELRSFIYKGQNRIILNQLTTYKFTGQEKPIEQIEQFQQQPPEENILEFNTKPNYISYTSLSKLDDNKNIVYFTKDHIQSNRITTNQHGSIEYQANYQPYGNTFTSQGEEKYKFGGKELDNSGLYYFGARYYDSDIGRFYEVDPIFKAQESPYLYANNNPLKFVDPRGKSAFKTNDFPPEILPPGFIGPPNENQVRFEDFFGMEATDIYSEAYVEHTYTDIAVNVVAEVSDSSFTWSKNIKVGDVGSYDVWKTRFDVTNEDRSRSINEFQSAVLIKLDELAELPSLLNEWQQQGVKIKNLLIATHGDRLGLGVYVKRNGQFVLISRDEFSKILTSISPEIFTDDATLTLSTCYGDRCYAQPDLVARRLDVKIVSSESNVMTATERDSIKTRVVGEFRTHSP